MPLSSLQILDEIKALVPRFDGEPAYLHTTCVRIAQFLHNGGALTPNFIALESAMLSLINSRLMLAGAARADPLAVAGTFTNRVNPRPLNGARLPAHLQNVLSTVLQQSETANGLSQPVMFTGFVAPTAFRGQLRKGRPFKDPAVPYGHGEFTHRIQWYLVFQGVPAPSGGWGSFYRWVGEMVEATPPNLGLWDILFDRNKVSRPGVNGPYDTTLPNDFRSPENLHKHLRHLPACPILQGFIEGRHRKRKNQGLVPPNTYNSPNFNNDAALRDYLSRKIFGVPYSELPLVDRPTLTARTPPNKILVRTPVQAISPETADEAMWRVFYDTIGW